MRRDAKLCDVFPAAAHNGTPTDTTFDPPIQYETFFGSSNVASLCARTRDVTSMGPVLKQQLGVCKGAGGGGGAPPALNANRIDHTSSQKHTAYEVRHHQV